MQVKA